MRKIGTRIGGCEDEVRVVIPQGTVDDTEQATDEYLRNIMVASLNSPSGEEQCREAQGTWYECGIRWGEVCRSTLS